MAYIAYIGYNGYNGYIGYIGYIGQKGKIQLFRQARGPHRPFRAIPSKSQAKIGFRFEI